MSLRVSASIGAMQLCNITIGRIDGLKSGKDMYAYRVRFSSKEWRKGVEVVTTPFHAYYSHGSLELIQRAMSHLLKEFPELRAGRFGVPRNRAKCRKCGDIVWSTHRHDFTSCSCGAISLDGGYDYNRVSAKNPKDVIYLPEPWQEPVPKKKVKK
jgi:hypothetical protein